MNYTLWLRLVLDREVPSKKTQILDKWVPGIVMSPGIECLLYLLSFKANYVQLLSSVRDKLFTIGKLSNNVSYCLIFTRQSVACILCHGI